MEKCDTNLVHRLSPVRLCNICTHTHTHAGSTPYGPGTHREQTALSLPSRRYHLLGEVINLSALWHWKHKNNATHTHTPIRYNHTHSTQPLPAIKRPDITYEHTGTESFSLFRSTYIGAARAPRVGCDAGREVVVHGGQQCLLFRPSSTH